MKKVSVLIPHYKTPDLLKLCLDLLKKYTPENLADYIVIDNNSEDKSVSYLKSLDWIKLIERKTTDSHETPPQSHARALDLGLQAVTTPYVLSIHTDTLVKHPDWLIYLLKKIESSPNIAGVGSWKLENTPVYKKMLKNIERKIQLFYYGLINKKNHAIEGKGNNYFYLRSHCALYRTDLLQKHQLKFEENHQPAGKVLHKKLVDHGHEMLFLTSSELGQYLDHINHATMVLNPELGVRKKSIKTGLARIKSQFERHHL